MTTSSQEGLSDIGQSTKGGDTKNNNDNDDASGDSSIPNWKKRIDISIAKSRKVRGSNYVQISTINYETMEPRCRTVVFRGFLKGVPFGAVEDVLNNGRVEVDAEGTTVTCGEEGEETKESYDCVMKMITDVRSNKVQELEMFHESESGEGKNANTVEMVWWFPKSSEQYRISGRLQFIGNNGPLYSYTDNDAKDDDDNTSTDRNNSYFMAERKQQWGNLSDMAREQFFWEKPGIPYSSSSTVGVESYAGVPPGGRDDDGKLLPPPDSFLIMLLYPSKIDYLRLTDNYRQVDEWDWVGDGGGCSERHWKSMRVNP